MAPLSTAGYLALAWSLFLLVDLFSVLEWDSFLVAWSGQPLLWFAVFNEWGPTEVLQWSFLLATAILGSRLGLRLRRQGNKPASTFWWLIAVTGILLALEDALTLRHHLAHFTMGLAGVEGRHPVRTGTELAYYAAIASVPIYALLRYWRVPWESPARWYLLTGFVAYGVAAVASASRDVGAWYVRLGTSIDEATGGRLGAGFVQTLPDRPVGFYIVDFIFEESLELMAAAFLLAAVLAFSTGYHNMAATAPARD